MSKSARGIGILGTRTVQAYATRLDNLEEGIGRSLEDSERIEKFRVDLRCVVQAKMD